MKNIKNSKIAKLLVSFADTTYGYDGGIYKASNWKLDGEVPSDYWYVKNGRIIVHKRTAWAAAKKSGLIESDYAKNNGLKKVYGMPKLRFIYRID